jgi:hypothetical protein
VARCADFCFKQCCGFIVFEGSFADVLFFRLVCGFIVFGGRFEDLLFLKAVLCTGIFVFYRQFLRIMFLRAAP